MASYRLAVTTAAIDASAKPGRIFGHNSKMRFHGQSSITCMPGKDMRSRIIDARRLPVTLYRLAARRVDRLEHALGMAGVGGKPEVAGIEEDAAECLPHAMAVRGHPAVS
jgi:hypothetical protein